MKIKKKYENAEIVKGILARETNYFDDIKTSIMFRFLDLENKDDKQFLLIQIDDMIKIFEDAKKELENNDE